MLLNGKFLHAGAAARFHGCLEPVLVVQTQFLYHAGTVLPHPLWQALEETMDFLLPSFPLFHPQISIKEIRCILPVKTFRSKLA